MTRFISLAALCGVLSSTASAAAPCTSYPGLVDGDGDKFCAFVGAATANSSGWNGKVDCDDDDKSIYPGAREVVADGIDQNCAGGDLVYPVDDAAYKRYVANSYGGRVPMPEVFVEEYQRCKTATGKCKPNHGKGKYDIVKPEEDILCDVYVAETSVLGSDGYREMVTLEEASYLYSGVKPGDPRCDANVGGKKASSGSSSSGTTGGASKAYVDGSTRVLREETTKAVDGLRSELSAAEKLRADEEKQSREVQTAVDKDQDEKLGNLRGRMNDAEERLTALEAEEGDGVFVEAGLAVVLMAGSGVTDQGMVVREGASTGVGLGFNIGTEGEETRSGVFFTGSYGRDGSDLAANVTFGAEYLWDWGETVAVGVNAGYAHRLSHCTALDVSVIGRMPMVGVSVAVPFRERAMLAVRANGGREYVSRIDDEVETDPRTGGHLSAGLVTRF